MPQVYELVVLRVQGGQGVVRPSGLTLRRELSSKGQPDKLEIAKFTQVWKKDASGWKLARVLSYDHKLTK